MLAVQRAKDHDGDCTLNVLPCRIKHNGPVNASERYWNPQLDPEGKSTSHFRGRKLWAQSAKVPEGYRGVVVNSTEKKLPSSNSEGLGRAQVGEVVEDEEIIEDIRIAEEKAEFHEIMVWGHESLPDKEDDAYMKGIHEWVSFAEKLHSEDDIYKPKESDVLNGSK